MRVREPSANPRQDTIVRLLRGEVAADRGTDVSAALAEQLLALVAEQCAIQPTVLVVDDLQWADPASVTLWARLARSVQQMPLLLVGMMRPVPQREDLLALRRVASDAACGCGSPGSLTRRRSPSLSPLVSAASPANHLLRLAGGAAGNPLYVIELVDALARRSSLTVTGAGTAVLASGRFGAEFPVGGHRGPPRLRLRPAREVLQAAALLGVDFAVPDLAIVLDRDIADLVPAIDEARAAGVLTEFRHRPGDSGIR